MKVRIPWSEIDTRDYFLADEDHCSESTETSSVTSLDEEEPERNIPSEPTSTQQTEPTSIQHTEEGLESKFLCVMEQKNWGIQG